MATAAIATTNLFPGHGSIEFAQETLDNLNQETTDTLFQIANGCFSQFEAWGHHLDSSTFNEVMDARHERFRKQVLNAQTPDAQRAALLGIIKRPSQLLMDAKVDFFNQYFAKSQPMPNFEQLPAPAEMDARLPATGSPAPTLVEEMNTQEHSDDDEGPTTQIATTAPPDAQNPARAAPATEMSNVMESTGLRERKAPAPTLVATTSVTRTPVHFNNSIPLLALWLLASFVLIIAYAFLQALFTGAR